MTYLRYLAVVCCCLLLRWLRAPTALANSAIASGNGEHRNSLSAGMIFRGSSDRPDWWSIGRRKPLRSGCSSSTLSSNDGRRSLRPRNSPVHDQVDYRLLGSAVARVRWELSIEQSWKRDPVFYVDQTLGSVSILLLQPPPFSEARQQEIVARVQQIPATIQAAQANLTDLRQPFAQLAIDALDQVAERCERMENALAPQLTQANNQALQQAMAAAVAALTQYRAWLTARLPTARKDTAIGRDNYIFFLRNVALVPLHPRAVAGDEPAGVEQSGRV